VIFKSSRFFRKDKKSSAISQLSFLNISLNKSRDKNHELIFALLARIQSQILSFEISPRSSLLALIQNADAKEAQD
jgi:hypothetical protein